MKRSYSSFVSLVLSLCLIFQCFILLPVIVNAEGNTTDVTILYEEISLRQENAKHFICSDGSYLAVSYPDAIHYWDGDEWKDIDNRLFYDESSGRYVNSENPTYQVSLDGAGTGEQTVVAGEFDATVDLTVQSGSGYTAVYNDICQRFKIVPVTSTSSASDYYILPYLRLQGEIKGSYREEYRLAVKNNELCIMYCASGNDPNCAQWEFWGDLSSCMLINRANGGHNGLGLSSSSTGVKIGISPSTFKWEIKPICLNVDKIYQETNYTCGAASSVMILNYLRPNASITETDYTTNMLEYFGKDNIYKEIGENYKYYNHYLGSNVYAYASIDNINKYFLTTANSLTLGYPIQVIMQSKSNEKSKLGYTTSGHFLVLKGQYYNPISQVYETVSNDCHYMFGPNDNNANTNNVGGRDLIIDFTTFYTISNYSWARIAYGINTDSVT